jgi:hypothetical protein
MDAAGIETPPRNHGRSLRGVLKRQSDQVMWRSTLVAEFHFHGATPFFPRRAITDGRYKLIRNLRAKEASESASVDGDQAYSEASRGRRSTCRQIPLVATVIRCTLGTP